ncbi:hypothetical protein [Streptomyces sp. NPDC001315]|uniref:hypothetical protein n=1 Tax=Streptomyces sp. NPDC001315 TaxID=3364562 RepID=UPI0036B3385B
MAVATLCVAPAAPAVTDGDTGGGKPTVVPVHGAFAGGSGRSGLIEWLERRGYTVMALAKRLCGLFSDSTHIASVLNSIKGRWLTTSTAEP